LVKEDLDAGSAPDVEFIATIADGVKHLRDQQPFFSICRLAHTGRKPCHPGRKPKAHATAVDFVT
jgi:hypothetical protein